MNASLAIARVAVKEMYRRKDFYVLFVLTALITLMMGSVNFFNDDKIVRYLKELCLLLIWVSALVISLAMSARQIPFERENRTIFPLLAKPVTRGDVIRGKFLGCWFAAGMALVLFYLFFGMVAGTKEHHWPVMNYFQALWLQWIFLGVVIGLSLLGSIIFAAPSSNITICFVVIAGILLLGRHLNTIALQQPEPLNTIIYTVYFIMPHLEFFDVRDLIVHNAPLIPWGPWALASLYGLFYAALFVFLSWLAFRKKPLN